MGLILIVEDDPERLKWFRQAFIGDVIHITKKVDDAINLLQNNEYKALFLDNDLSFNDYAAGDSVTPGMGYDVALFLEEFPENNPNMFIVVHSCNTYASGKICMALRHRRMEKIPFPKLKEMRESGCFKLDI